MKKILVQLVPILTFLMFSIVPAFGFGGGSMTTNDQEEPIVSEEILWKFYRSPCFLKNMRKRL
jgi:hypothetical protein